MFGARLLRLFLAVDTVREAALPSGVVCGTVCVSEGGAVGPGLTDDASAAISL